MVSAMGKPSRHTGRLEGRTITLLTIVGLGVVLAAFAALMIGGALRGQSAADQVARSGDLAEAYLLAQDAMSREDQVEDVFKDDPDPALEREFRAAAHDFGAAMAKLERSPDVRDRDLAERATGLHRRYVVAMHDIFDAAAEGDEDRIEEINDERMDPAQDALQPLVNGTGPEYAVAQLAEIDDLRSAERRELIATLAAVPIGILLYVLLVIMFTRQRRRLDRMTRAEVIRLEEAAHTDSLTGLLNHRALQRDLAALDPGEHAMAMLDVVGLKAVNDGAGHMAGDALLQNVAVALREEVAGLGRAYRIGGDEFAMILPRLDETDARQLVLAAHVRVTVRHPGGLRGGVACDEPDRLLAKASAALLEARQTDELSRVA
jgi:GGDEF domain-containing protein